MTKLTKINGLGEDGLEDVPPKKPKKPKLNNPVDPEMVEQFKAKVIGVIDECGSHREILEKKADNLAICVGIAAEMYKRTPVMDNAYPLSALTNAYNSALSQMDKMRDPKQTLSEVEGQIRLMFTTLVKALVLEIEKAKNDIDVMYPNDKATIEDIFSRMMESIQPESQNIYDGLLANLKKSLGIK